MKRLQETVVDNLKTKYGQFHDVSAHHLESIGFQESLDTVCLALKNVYDTVKVSVDGDLSFAKILRDKQKASSDYLGIELNFDIAHLKKNVQKIITAILQSHKFSGDSEGKIGNQNKLRLCSYIKTPMVKINKIFSELEDKLVAKQSAIDEINRMKNHCLGVHDECYEDGENCSQEAVLRTYGNKFNQDQLDNLLKDIFDNWLLSVELLNKLENAGSTSNLESFHSIFTNRNLWTKTGSLHVSTPKFDGIVAIASTYFNFENSEKSHGFGRLGDFRRITEEFGSSRKKRDSQLVYKMKAKSEVKQERLRKQQQHQPTTKYRKLHPYIPSKKAAKKLAKTNVRVSRKK